MGRTVTVGSEKGKAKIGKCRAVAAAMVGWLASLANGHIVLKVIGKWM